jgi:hypothetical protein
LPGEALPGLLRRPPPLIEQFRRDLGDWSEPVAD